MPFFFRGAEICTQANVTVHTCNTPACVVGYASIDDDFIDVLRTQLVLSNIYYNDLTDPNEIWEALSTLLIIECNVSSFFCPVEFYDSIFESLDGYRFRSANKLGLFTRKQLEGYEHLNMNDPTPKHAKAYIDLLIAKVNDFKDE